jgi:pimeloyl-ACP methyl ester carboxylesterase
VSASLLAENPLSQHSPDVSGHPDIMYWAARAAIGVAGGYILDQELGHRTRWSRPVPTITEYPAEAGVSPQSAVLVTAGFNSRPEATADPLRRTFTHFGRLAMFQDSHAGLSFKDNFETIATWAKATSTKDVVLYGPSMGTLLNLAVAPMLRHDAGLNVQILMDSSLESFDDLKGASRRAMVRTLAHMSLRGGPATRVVLETIGYSIDNASNPRGFVDGFAHAFRKIRDNGIQSNAQCIDRSKLLLHADTAPYLRQLEDVPIVYMGPDDPERDPVVNNTTSLAAYRRKHRAGIIHVTSPAVGHANPADNPDAHNFMTYRGMRALGHRATA